MTKQFAIFDRNLLNSIYKPLKKEIKRVENEINNRPVRKFGYLTPNEVFLHRR
jgi:IS30 family transposase